MKETTTNPDGEEFGTEQLCSAIAGTRGEALDRGLDAILGEVAARRGCEQFSDDISLVAVEMLPGRPRVVG